MITIQQAVQLKSRAELVHVTLKDSKGAPTRCRVNGKCQTWATRPHAFKLPVKYGLKTCFYITDVNAGEWNVPD